MKLLYFLIFCFIVVLNVINDWEIVLSLCMLLGMCLLVCTLARFSDGKIDMCSGEVTHYQCRELFSRHLLNTRG